MRIGDWGLRILEGRSQEPGARRKRAEVGGRRLEVRGQKTDYLVFSNSKFEILRYALCAMRFAQKYSIPYPTNTTLYYYDFYGHSHINCSSNALNFISILSTKEKLVSYIVRTVMTESLSVDQFSLKQSRHPLASVTWSSIRRVVRI